MATVKRNTTGQKESRQASGRPRSRKKPISRAYMYSLCGVLRGKGLLKALMEEK